jgi:hypothetical protein
MRDEDADVTVDVASLREASKRELNADTAFTAGSDAAAFRSSGSPITTTGELSITLPPFGLVTIDGTLNA